jgi:hypothetical protein
MTEQEPLDQIDTSEQAVPQDVTVSSLSGADKTSINDVIHLREWGADTTYKFPERPVGSRFVGTSRECVVRLADPGVAPTHAQLTFDGAQWWIHCCKPAYGLLQDGVPRERFMLTPMSRWEPVRRR